MRSQKYRISTDTALVKLLRISASHTDEFQRYQRYLPAYLPAPPDLRPPGSTELPTE